MIDLITLHDICNPGSVFQAYALNKFINDIGYDCRVIDYVPPYSHVGKNKLKGLIKQILFGKNNKIIKDKYRDFMKQNMRLTAERYTSYAELKDKLPTAQLYISGSDQLWNRDYDCGNDEAYYLSFVDGAPKISYATSLGKKQVSDEDIKFIANRIKDFIFVSVRERSSCDMLAPVLDKDVKWVCDPVFLLDKNDYLKNAKRLVDGKYIVIYLSAGTELLEEIIGKVRDDGYKVILLGGSITRCTCDLHIKDMGPEDFISLLYYADAVLSSSFHATAFSHIFHKKFGAILPEKNGERIESLLSLSGLEKHIINKADDYKVLFEDIDYEGVDQRITPFVAESKKFLINAISTSLK